MTQRKTTKKSSKRTAEKKSATRGGTRSRTAKKTTTRKPASRKSSTPRKKTPRKKRSALTVKQQSQRRAIVLGVFAIFSTFLISLSLISPEQGEVIRNLARLMKQLFGGLAFIVPLMSGAIGYGLLSWGMDQPLKLSIFRPLGVLLLFIVLETTLSLWQVTGDRGFSDVWQVAQAGRGGGYFGGLFAYIFLEAIGLAGAVIALFIVGMVGVVWMSGVTQAQVIYVYGEMLRWWRTSQEERRQAAQAEAAKRPLTYRRGGKAQPLPKGNPQQLPLIEDPVDTVQKLASSAEEPKPEPAKSVRKSSRRTKKEPEPVVEQPTIVTPVYMGNNGRSTGGQTPNWKLPDINEMLEPGRDLDPSGAAIREQVEIIEHTLESFGAPASIVEINQGPTITQFGVEPSFIQMRNGKRTKVKVSKIAGLADDLALALAAESIRIQAPVPGKGFIGIEVPNPAKAVVSLKDVMETPEYEKLKSPLRIGLGQDVAGQPIVADLASMPHLLIAGTTGSGKSVCVNGIIASLLLQNTPETLKLVMVDPKRVELTGYNGIPHLAAPVIVEIDKVIGTLQWALREMDNRYKMFADIGARNIVDFNKKVPRHQKYDPLPYIVIIIDELADLMMLSPEDTERSITRLAQLARATGMHMVIATQRPSVDVVTGLIKANFPARVAFAVASGTDSRVILDSTGAERLLGQGDMLYQAPDAPAPIRSQGCFVSDPELKKLIAYWQTARRFNVVSASESIQKRDTVAPPPVVEAPKREMTTPASVEKAVDKVVEEETAVKAPIINMKTKTPPAEAPTVAIEPPRPNPKPRHIGEKPQPPVEKDAPATQPIPEIQQPLWEALQAVDEEDDTPDRPEDDLLDEAIALVRELDKASTSLLQRRFRIGYTRAARLIDYMDEAGIIGPPTGTSKAREVMPWDDDATIQSESSTKDDPSIFDIEFNE